MTHAFYKKVMEYLIQKSIDLYWKELWVFKDQVINIFSNDLVTEKFPRNEYNLCLDCVFQGKQLFSLILLFTGTLQGASFHSKGEKNRPGWKEQLALLQSGLKACQDIEEHNFLFLNYSDLWSPGYLGLSRGVKLDFSENRNHLSGEYDKHSYSTATKWGKISTSSLQSDSKLDRRVELLQLFFPRSVNTGYYSVTNQLTQNSSFWRSTGNK